MPTIILFTGTLHNLEFLRRVLPRYWLFLLIRIKKTFLVKKTALGRSSWMSYIHAQLYSVFFLSFNFRIQDYKLCFRTVLELYPEPYLEPCKTIKMEWFVKYLTGATSKTWTGTLDPHPEKPGPSKTCTLKNLNTEKPGPEKTWILKNMEWIWD